MELYRQKYFQWCTSDTFDDETKAELQALKDEKEIEDRFYKDLSFGTGGLRGILGAGTNRMNIYTITKTTQGLANFVNKCNPKRKGVVIAYDSRIMSLEFSEAVALCLNANGIKTYRFESLRPTPELSFAVRELNCIAGIVITASHNPKEYNGYKVYWEDGGQITAPLDRKIIDEVYAVKCFSDIQKVSKNVAVNQGLYHSIGHEIDERYIEELKKSVCNWDVIRKMNKELRIVYTPLHGAGNKLVQLILKELGFTNVFVVSEQEDPDGNFPTVNYPNPEETSTFDLALELAEKVDADIVLATDPDADRLGVYSKDTIGKYVGYTGNMSGLLICEYLLESRAAMNMLPANRKDAAIVKTIVSSNMADEIADYYNVTLIEVLTGFKYIGEQIKLFDKQREKNDNRLSAADSAYEYLFGFEESYGCLVGTHARDKDAVAAVMSLCEAASFYKSKGITLWGQMLNIYDKYGYFMEDLISVILRGKDGLEKINKIMERCRQTPPHRIGCYQVKKFRDYLNGTCLSLQDKQLSALNLPSSNVLYFELSNDAWICIRPSGTEPKIKIYMGVKGMSLTHAHDELEKLKKAVSELVSI